jgi:hypothetical protein
MMCDVWRRVRARGRRGGRRVARGNANEDVRGRGWIEDARARRENRRLTTRDSRDARRTDRRRVDTHRFDTDDAFRTRDRRAPPSWRCTRGCLRTGFIKSAWETARDAPSRRRSYTRGRSSCRICKRKKIGVSLGRGRRRRSKRDRSCPACEDGTPRRRRRSRGGCRRERPRVRRSPSHDREGRERTHCLVKM